MSLTAADTSLQARWERVMAPNYATPGIEIVSGQGAHVVDADGRRYLDLLAGLAVNILGHAHPAIVKAVTQQVATLGHVSNLYAHPQGLRLADRLAGLIPGAKALLVNSGTEANEAAYKMVRRAAHDQGREDAVILAFDGSFHGRTLAGLALTGQERHRQGFGRLPGPIRHVAFNDPGALEDACSRHDVIAVFAEIVQGEGGVVPMTPEFARAVAKATQAADTALVVDEVQTGIARTGRFFAFEHHDLAPDIVTLAKGLGGGLPIGAVLARTPWAEALTPGTHGCTFGGNPISAAAANAVLDVIKTERLEARAARLGATLHGALVAGLGPDGPAPRGLGMLQGVPLPGPGAGDVVQAAQQDGILVGQAGPAVTRLSPPLVIEEDDLVDGAARVARVITAAKTAVR